MNSHHHYLMILVLISHILGTFIQKICFLEKVRIINFILKLNLIVYLVSGYVMIIIGDIIFLRLFITIQEMVGLNIVQLLNNFILV